MPKDANSHKRAMLKISQKTYNALIVQAQEGLPYEVCGYLAEEDGIVATHYEMTNTDAAADHFSMKPEEQFAAIKDMREKRLIFRGVYHSHPETPARPSEEDIRLAYDPDVSYVIISLAADKPDIKSFKITKGNVTPEQIEVIEGKL